MTHPRAARRGLSKSRFVSGLQCVRKLWWQVVEPDAPELHLDPWTQKLLDQGHRVGEKAREYVPGGVLIDLDRRNIVFAVEQTRDLIEAVEQGHDHDTRAIYEASFYQDGVFVAVDILERTPTGWVLIEVKSSLHLKPEHIPDVAIQMHVLQCAGIDVVRAEVMHLNPQCRAPDLRNLFLCQDVTEQASELLADIPNLITTQQRALSRPQPPKVEPGDHCSSPRPCPFRQRCQPNQPKHHISELYRIGKKPLRALEAAGYETIHDIPADVELTAIQDRQRRAVTSGELVVEPGLAIALDLQGPLGYLDFETINPAIPVYDGTGPFAHVAVQWSLHVEQADGTVTHDEFLVEPGVADPRRALAEALLAATAGVRTVLAWHAPFEIARLRELGVALPDLADALNDLADRTVDLLAIVREHVYHPEFCGAFGLKSVLPALCPGVGWSDLEIPEGGTASSLLERMLLNPEEFEPAERERVRGPLLDYCRRDTAALVEVMNRLRCGDPAGLNLSSPKTETLNN